MRKLEKIPRNIIFDFGGVLADIDISHAVRTFTDLGVGPIDESDIHPYNKGIFLALEKGQISAEEFLNNLHNMSKSARVLTDKQLVDAWNAIILPLDYDRFPTLLDLRKNGHKVFLLSNTNVIHHDYFEGTFDRENPFGMKFRDFFDYVYYSDEMGMRKPDEEIYRKVLDEQNLIPQETIFIDDNQINLEAPVRLGMQVYHFTREDSIANLFSELYK